jgi:hypothetical protein
MFAKSLPRRPFSVQTFRILDLKNNNFVHQKKPDILYVPDRSLNFKPRHGKVEVYKTNEDIQSIRLSSYVIGSITAVPLYCMITNFGRGRWIRGLIWSGPAVFLG